MTLLSQAMRLACKAASVVVMARLVPPGEHGLWVMATSFVLVLYIARDLGLGAMAVQADTLTPGQLKRLCFAQIGLGMAGAALSLLGAAGIATFYRQPELTPLVMVLGLIFPLSAIGGTPRVVLTRDMRLATIARIETVTAVIATLAMIFAGWRGAGAYSFAVFWLTNEGLTAIGLGLAARWRPTTAPAESLGPLWAQGRTLSAQSLLQFLAQQIDGIIIARWFGAAPAGLYSRAAQILSLPTQHVATPIAQVTTATLARCRHDPPAFSQHALGSFRFCAWSILPALAVVGALPDAWIRLLLGPDWAGSAAVVPGLVVAAGCAALNAPLLGIAMATDRIKALWTATLIGLPLLGGAIAVGTRHGLVGVATAVAGFQLLTLLPRWAWVTRDTVLGLRAILGAVGPAIILALAMAITTSFAAACEGWLRQLGLGLTLGLFTAAGLLTGSQTLRASLGGAINELLYSKSSDT